MHWTLETLEKILEIYKEQRLLWDRRHPSFHDKDAREKAMEHIYNKAKSKDSPNLSVANIARKIRTMRAAYQVECRNIRAAKLRGFYYKPTLTWFNSYRRFAEDIQKLVAQEEDKNDFHISLEVGESSANTFVLNVNQRDIQSNKDYEEKMEDDDDLGRDDGFSEDSEDEFQLFADHIAEQLRTMSTHKAVQIQNSIQRLFAKDRELYDIEIDS